MAAKDGRHKALWAELQQELDLEDPGPPDRFLGCYKKRFTATAGDVSSTLGNRPQLFPRQAPGEKKPSRAEMEQKKLPLSSIKGYDPKRQVNGYVYDMEEYFAKNLDRCMTETGCSRKRIKYAATPFVDESGETHGHLIFDEASNGGSAS